MVAQLSWASRSNSDVVAAQIDDASGFALFKVPRAATKFQRLRACVHAPRCISCPPPRPSSIGQPDAPPRRPRNRQCSRRAKRLHCCRRISTLFGTKRLEALESLGRIRRGVDRHLPHVERPTIRPAVTIRPAESARGHRNDPHADGVTVHLQGNRCDRHEARARAHRTGHAYVRSAFVACTARDWRY